MQVGSWFLFFGPSTLVLIFHILAVGSFILVSSICSAFSVAFSSLIMSSRFWRCDCLRFVCFLCEMPFGLNLMPKASMSISTLASLGRFASGLRRCECQLVLLRQGLSYLIWYDI